MDDGSLQYCDGNATPALKSGFLQADTVDDDVPESGHFGNLTAGNGLTLTTGTMVVNLKANSGLELQTDEIAIATSFAGDGLTYSGGVLAVGAGDGIARTAGTTYVDSQEAHFLRDGATTSLTCGAGAEGKMQVMDSGALQYCDGNATSALKAGFLDADGSDDDVPESGDFGNLTAGHQTNISEKLKIHSRAGLIKVSIQKGIIKIE